MSHVLIVDDDSNTREALVAIAQAEGFTTAGAGSVAEARIQLGRQRPDVVMRDLRLPDGSGMDLFEDGDEQGLRNPQEIRARSSCAHEAAPMARQRPGTQELHPPRLHHGRG